MAAAPEPAGRSWAERWAEEVARTEEALREAALRLGAPEDYRAARRRACVVWHGLLGKKEYEEVRRGAEGHAEALIARGELLERGNRKLGRSVLVWTLPEVHTCPTPSPFCLMVCYSRRRTRMVAPRVERGEGLNERARRVLVGRLARFFAALRPDFAEAVSRQIDAEKRRGRVLVRIHQDGDFFSPGYFAKWLAIAERHPDARFMAFTKVVPALGAFVERGGPRNLVLLYSLDRSNMVLLPTVAQLVREGAAKGLGVGTSYIYTPSGEEVERALRELAGEDVEALDGYEREVLGAAPRKRRRRGRREEEAAVDRENVERIKSATGAEEFACPYDRWETVARIVRARYNALLRRARRDGKPEPPRPKVLEREPRCGIACTYCFDPAPTPKLVLLWKH